MAKVTSLNPFDLLEDADYDGQIKPSKPQPKAKKETVAPAATQTQSAKKQDSRPVRDNRGPRNSGPRGDFEAPRAPRNKDDKKKHNKNSAPRRGREFDRHSGTGRVDSEKAKEQFVGKATENYEEVAKEDAEKESKSEDAVETPVEPVDDSKTLEEYYAELAASKTNKETKETRKPNEGSDDSKWKDGVVLQKEEEDFFTGKSVSKANKKKEKSSKTFVDIEQKFNAPEKERRDNRPRGDNKSGRGNNRGGRGNNRGNNRGAKNTPRPIPLNDQVAFPSLGSN